MASVPTGWVDAMATHPAPTTVASARILRDSQSDCQPGGLPRTIADESWKSPDIYQASVDAHGLPWTASQELLIRRLYPNLRWDPASGP